MGKSSGGGRAPMELSQSEGVKRKSDQLNENDCEPVKKQPVRFLTTKRGLFKDINMTYKDDKKDIYPILVNCDNGPVNLLQVNGILRNLADVSHVKQIGFNYLKIFFKTLKSANAFLLNTDILTKNKWTAKIPFDHIESQGLIRAPTELTEKELLEELKATSDIIGVKRFMKRKEDGNLIPLQLVLITFHSTTRPDHVIYDRLWFDVQDYIKPIAQCFKCYKFGHSSGSCKSKQICSICSENHFFKECTNKDTIKCANCAGPHIAVSRLCPVKVSKMQEIKMKVAKRTYSSVVANQSAKLSTKSSITSVSQPLPSGKSPQGRALITDVLNSDLVLNALTKTVNDLLKNTNTNQTNSSSPISSKLIKDLLINNFNI